MAAEHPEVEGALKQRRLKWGDQEIKTLWSGIFTYGNEWREIQKTLPGRTYHQVKDKGRRLLHKCGWSTGRTKSYSEGARSEAKTIAGYQLSKLLGKKMKKRKPSGGKAKPPAKKRQAIANGSGHSFKVLGMPLAESYTVGMNKRVEDLRVSIAACAQDFPNETTTVQVSGDFGSGKSALVKEYVHKFKDFYVGGVYWIDACLFSKLKSQLRIMAEQWLAVTLNSSPPGEETIETLLAAIWNALEPSSKWLLIFDNVQDQRVFELIAPPQKLKGKGTVLLLCETANEPLLRKSTVHPVSPLQSAECIALLEEITGVNQDKLSDEQRKAFGEFINDKTVQGMPGSLKITAHYIAKHGLSNIENFLSTLKALREEMDFSNHDKYFAGRILTSTNASLYETFARSNLIEALWCAVRPKLEPDARNLLELCSLLCPNSIPSAILAEALGGRSKNSQNASNKVQPISQSIQALSDIALVLCDETYSVVTVSSCMQNAVVQTLVREKRFFETVCNVFDCFDVVYKAVSVDQFLPHLSSVLGRISHFINSDSTKSAHRTLAVAKVQKYVELLKEPLAEDGFGRQNLVQRMLETPKSLDQDATQQGLQVVAQIESFLSPEETNSNASTLAKTFTARV